MKKNIRVTLMGLLLMVMAGGLYLAKEAVPANKALPEGTQAVKASNPVSIESRGGVCSAVVPNLLGENPNAVPGKPMPELTHEGNPTAPCPETQGCGPCGTTQNCHDVDTGEHACGWDGTTNPPEINCGKTLTIHVTRCECAPWGGPPPVPLCPDENQSLASTVCQ